MQILPFRENDNNFIKQKTQFLLRKFIEAVHIQKMILSLRGMQVIQYFTIKMIYLLMFVICNNLTMNQLPWNSKLVPFLHLTHFVKVPSLIFIYHNSQ